MTPRGESPPTILPTGAVGASRMWQHGAEVLVPTLGRECALT